MSTEIDKFRSEIDLLMRCLYTDGYNRGFHDGMLKHRPSYPKYEELEQIIKDALEDTILIVEGEYEQLKKPWLEEMRDKFKYIKNLVAVNND